MSVRQRKTTLSLETWYYLVVMGFILAGALLREINLLIVLFGMMVGPLLYNWWAVVVTLRGLEVRRQTPPAICAGDLLVVERSDKTVGAGNQLRSPVNHAVHIDQKSARHVYAFLSGNGAKPRAVGTRRPARLGERTLAQSAIGRVGCRERKLRP